MKDIGPLPRDRPPLGDLLAIGILVVVVTMEAGMVTASAKGQKKDQIARMTSLLGPCLLQEAEVYHLWIEAGVTEKTEVVTVVMTVVVTVVVTVVGVCAGKVLDQQMTGEETRSETEVEEIQTETGLVIEGEVRIGRGSGSGPLSTTAGEVGRKIQEVEEVIEMQVREE